MSAIQHQGTGKSPDTLTAMIKITQHVEQPEYTKTEAEHIETSKKLDTYT